MYYPAQVKTCANCFWTEKCRKMENEADLNAKDCDYYELIDLLAFDMENYMHDLDERQAEYDQFVAEMNG